MVSTTLLFLSCSIVLPALTNTECTSGAELLVNGTPWSYDDTPLYKPIGSDGVFVRCQRCDNNRNPNWFNSSGDKIPKCDDKMSHTICVNHIAAGIRGLKFLGFLESQVGNYTCKHNNDENIITINALSLLPIHQLITDDMTVALNCETTGEGSITYQWETSNINGGQWMNISNSNNKTLVVGTLEQSQQYMCVVSNEAGSTRSNVATVTVLKVTTHPQDMLAPVNSTVSLMCTASVSSDVMFSWTHIRTSISGSLTTGDTSILTITRVRESDAGSYACTVRSGSLSVMSNVATLTVYGPPVIMDNPTSKSDVPMGKSITLTCRAIGIGTLVYSWERSSGSSWTTVSNDNTRSYTTDTTLAIGQYMYRCKVSNEAGSVVSDVATLTIYGPPTIMTNPTNQLTTMRISVTLDCEGTGRGSIVYQWESKEINSEKWMNVINSNRKTLVVENLKRSQRYRCVVSNEAGSTRSNIATVTVLKITTQPASSTNVVALENVTLRCSSSVDGVTYSWHRVHGDLPPGSLGQNSNRFTIVEATPTDGGMYYCMVSKERIKVESNRATINVNDQLSIQATPTSRIIGEGGMATFTATASGINKNNFMYQWRKRGSNGLPDKVSVVNETILLIPNLIKSDEGQYYCIVTNEWGRSVESDDIILTVAAGLPLFQRHPQNEVVNNKQSVTFECFANGSNSSLSVTWERNNRTYNSGNVENMLHSNGVRSILTINTVTVRNDGKYRCRATNVDGNTTLSDEAELIIFPEITNNPNNVTVLIGQPSQLSCRAQGTDIAYQWIKDDVSLPNDNSRMLKITNTMESDEGVYKCVASNKGGMVESDPATVTVYGPPMVRLPQQLHAVLGREFQITCAATNDQDALMNLTLSWTTPNDIDITTTDEHSSLTIISTLHISNVTHDHGGMYQCTASNGKRRGNSVSVSSTLVVEEKSSPPINFSITHINATSFQLMWSSPRNPHGVINYYTVYYSSNSHDQSFQVVNDANFDGTYILSNLTPYTIYSVHVTAVRLIGGNSDRPLEGMKSEILTERTFAGEPEITELEVDQSMPEILLNLNSSMTSRRSTFDINLPQILTTNGPFSHFYIIVVINSSANDVKALTTQELLEHSMNNSMLLYIAAVVNASQYVQYADGYRMKYILGAGDNTTDVYSNVFHNREVKSEYSFFYRVFSVNSTLENEIYSNSEIKKIPSPQQSTGASSSSSNAAGPIIGVIVALLLIIAVIIIVILLLFLYKKKYSKPKDTGLSKVVPTDAGVQLNNKEMKDKDAKPLSSLAATNPFPQETSFSPNSPLPMEVTTSVGQPTTLFVELPYADDSEITWQKDGKSVSHPVLLDGSLYIANTKINDQGDYTVTATATDNTTSEMLKLIVIDPKMPTTLSDHKPVKVEDFPEHIALMQSKKSIQFEEDYESVMVDLALSQHAAKLHVNASKNRYKNIVPYDHCRVVLTQQDQKPGSDYFNASFVDGYKEPKAYIATQGPVSNTVDDFWRMIWEHNVTTIVMLTRLVEDAKIKCHQYWPESESAVYGNFKVTIIKHEVIAKYCIRNLIVEKISEHKSREVHQFHFTAWPDHGVPKYGTDILEFQKRIDKYHKRKDGKPMVVHCSAGVGRTGTFIAIDIEIQRINQESLVDVYNCVCSLRFWRNFMVQTVDQYTLIFTALLEHIACGDTSIAAPTKSVQDKVKELSAVDPHTKKTGFETQFETLTKNSPKEKEFAYSAASKNKSKNRNKKCLPPDTSRVHLSKVGDKSDYINACYIEGYRHCKEFLVGPGPMESTSADFWRMVWEKQSHAIVILGQLKENGEEASFQYWPKKDDKCEFGNLTVQTTSEDPVDNNVTKRVMKITHKETSATRTITQLQYVEWPQNSTPSNTNSIIDLTEILERVQRKTANGPIAVHCSDGIGRSGTFCALVVSINRFKAEQMVDVFKTIITMRSQRPGLVANAEQYKFIHEAIINMLLRFATYSNFSNDNITTDGVYENLPSSSM